MPPSDRAIDLFLSRVSSNRNRAILYLGITDSSVDDAVALFNSKPDASFRAAISRSAVQFRRPLANGAKGYEDKYGVIHLETSTEDENDEEVEIVGGLTGGNEQIRMRENGENISYATRGALKVCETKFIYPITEHRPLRAATSEHEEAPGTMSRSYLGDQITIKSTEKRAKKNRRASNRDPTFEPEENSGTLDQMSPTGHKRLPQLRHRGRFAISPTSHKRLPQQRHRGRFAREEKILDTELETADDEKPISARTRRSTVGRLPKKKQCSRPRSSLPTYKRSPKKRATGICSLCQTVYLMIKLTSQTQKRLLLHPLPVKRFQIQRPPPPLLIAAHYWNHQKNTNPICLRRTPRSPDLNKRRKTPPVLLTLALLYLQTFSEWPRVQPRSASPQDPRQAALD